MTHICDIRECGSTHMCASGIPECRPIYIFIISESAVALSM